MNENADQESIQVTLQRLVEYRSGQRVADILGIDLETLELLLDGGGTLTDDLIERVSELWAPYAGLEVRNPDDQDAHGSTDADGDDGHQSETLVQRGPNNLVPAALVRAMLAKQLEANRAASHANRSVSPADAINGELDVSVSRARAALRRTKEPGDRELREHRERLGELTRIARDVETTSDADLWAIGFRTAIADRATHRIDEKLAARNPEHRGWLQRFIRWLIG